MNCLKCGKEIEEKQVFCDSCLAVMEKFPVKPETKIYLPKNAPVAPVKKSAPRKKTLSPEERILRLKKAIHILCIMLVVAISALVLSIALLVESMTVESSSNAIGQNYGTITDDRSNR